jgi:MoxR-like ATPase
VSEPTTAPRPDLPADPGALAAALEASGYLPDEGLATAAYLALVMHRPLFLEGEAGVGKTALARALAEVTGRPLYRLQCYEGLEASQALYDWDFGRQLLHLRAAEAAHEGSDTAALEASLYDRRFLLARPLLQALEDSPSVLLVDELARPDDEFEAFLLKPPGVAEAMDWASALHALGARELDPDTAARTLGAVLKYREDTDRVHSLARGALFGGA